MKRMKWPVWLLTVILGAALIIGMGTVLAGAGDESDPLVALSYLTDQLTPSLLKEVDQKITDKETSFVSNLQKQVSDFAASVGAGSKTAEDTYEVVIVMSGQTLTGAVGTEVLLRSGTGICVAADAPGLVDMTGGGLLQNGSALTANHLYMMTVDGRGVRANGNTVTLLVRGSYTIS